MESNNHQPHPFHEIHQNLPPKKQCMELRDPAINVSKVREQVLENIVHPGCNWSYVDESNAEFLGSLVCDR